MIFAPNSFDDFLKNLFIVNDASMVFWNGDNPVEYEDKARRWDELVNRRYIKNTHDRETLNYLSSYQKFDRMPEGINNSIITIEKVIKVYNNHIRNRIFWCNFTLKFHFGFLIEDIVEDKLNFWLSIDMEVLIDYFKNNVLNSPDSRIISRFNIMEIE